MLNRRYLCGIYAVFQGFEELGYSLIGINLAAVAGVFVLGRKRDAETENKTESHDYFFGIAKAQKYLDGFSEVPLGTAATVKLW